MQDGCNYYDLPSFEAHDALVSWETSPGESILGKPPISETIAKVFELSAGLKNQANAIPTAAVVPSTELVPMSDAL